MKRFDSEELGKYLLDCNILSEDEKIIAIRESKKRFERIDKTIIRLGYADEDALAPKISEFLELPYILLRDHTIDPEIISKIAVKIAHHYKFMPVSLSDGKLHIATNDPSNIELLDEIRLAVEFPIEPLFSSESEIAAALKKYYGIGAETVQRMLDESESTIEIEKNQFKAEDIASAEDLAEDASIIKFVNQIFCEAYSERATDIHIEPFENDLKIRYRIDGILYNASIPPMIKRFHNSIVSRIKIMANLDISERRLPHDGRIKIKIGSDELDLRVSILPTAFGESVNIRILSGSLSFLTLEQLGLLREDQKLIESMIKKPHGILFVTGPTGSGKTTTLYACLSRLNNDENKIITIEDPIEYVIKGLSQIQIQEKIGLTFARGLRSMLRHDPDIMMIGEVRDYETAEVTIRVALTGHLVFSTVHTNDASGAITRLIDMGVEPYLVASSLEGVLAQRLVRLICKDCKTVVHTTPDHFSSLGVTSIPNNFKSYEGKGCESCNFTGYRGRTAIYELLQINDEIRDLIVSRKPANVIKEAALRNGLRTLRFDGWEKVKQGITSLNEVLRVTQEGS
ncbi:MAG: ATPase, T2SS/T4P/T4SS family [Candidatus Theseobacter exili]|nr:ATPase, T2SS/T4P/T4SS family [Candidatus Theseobacter exili]